MLEAAQKIAQESRPPLKESAFRLAATRDEDERLALGAVHAERRAQLEAAEAKELALLAEFTGLDAVAALFDVFTAVLKVGFNSGVGTRGTLCCLWMAVQMAEIATEFDIFCVFRACGMTIRG